MPEPLRIRTRERNQNSPRLNPPSLNSAPYRISLHLLQSHLLIIVHRTAQKSLHSNRPQSQFCSH